MKKKSNLLLTTICIVFMVFSISFTICLVIDHTTRVWVLEHTLFPKHKLEAYKKDYNKNKDKILSLEEKIKSLDTMAEDTSLIQVRKKMIILLKDETQLDIGRLIFWPFMIAIMVFVLSLLLMIYSNVK
jgi:hypothetical protein